MWWRFSAGAVLGLPLSIAIIGLLTRLAPGGWSHLIVPALLLFAPLWVGIMAGSTLFRSTAKAWSLLLALNLLVYLLLWGTRHALA
ncbi:hypothetical protein [Silvimonas sp.]|uniref:hypothetical protein n=1 Tax=Silvimonas sp. TaxID=2650811 RepID=UPI0028522755|nr:hypothetical protein [Silvimonas sp.]MDR3428433.1 hypothetical protein [Silvimonas sp.]